MSGDFGLMGPTDQLNTLRDEALRIAEAHGFKHATIGEDIALMHSELSEALEDHRHARAPSAMWYEEVLKLIQGDIEYRAVVEHYEPSMPVPGLKCPFCEGKGCLLGSAGDRSNPTCDRCNGSGVGHVLLKPCGIPSELADVIIRVLHFAGTHKIDIAKAVREKMAYNATRPFKHGGKTL